MKYAVQITARALTDAEEVLRWFNQQQAQSAGQRWLRQLWTRIDSLEKHPQRCGPAVESADLELDIRELVFGGKQGRYRILFRIAGSEVVILRVWHAARDKVTEDDV